MEFTQSTKPETYKKLFGRAIKLYRVGFNKVIGLALFLSLIVFLPRIADFIKGRNVLEVVPFFDESSWLPVINIVCLILFIIILERFQFTIKHKKDKLNKDFILSLKKIPFVFLASIVQTFIYVIIALFSVGLFALLQKLNLVQTTHPLGMAAVIAPFFLIILFEFYLLFALFFYVPLIVTENAGILQSLKRSFQLVWGNWWSTLFLQLTPWIGYLVILSALRYGVDLNFHVFYDPNDGTNLLAMVVHIFIFALFVPLFASTMLVQLHDLELRYQLKVKPKHTKPKRITKKKS